MQKQVKKTVETKPKAKTNETVATPQKTTKGSGLWLFVIFILVLVSLCGAGYVAYQFDLYKTQMVKELNQLQTAVDAKPNASDVSAQIATARQPIESALVALQKRSEIAQQQRQALNNSSAKLFELYGRDKNGWQMAEVEYLLRIAQHRLIIENDFQGAINTLKAADDKIIEIADPGLLPVRVAISDERVLLQSRTRPDLAGMVLSLTRIIRQIPALQLKSAQQVEVAAKTEMPETSVTTVQDGSADWQTQALQWFKGQVKVEPLQPKAVKQPIEEVIKVDVAGELDEHLKLAKWSILDRDQRQFTQLLQKSILLFNQSYDLNDPYHAEISDELTRLSGLEIKPELPDISTSLLRLKQIMQRKDHALKEQVEAEPSEVTEEANDEGVASTEVEAPVVETQPTELTGENNE